MENKNKKLVIAIDGFSSTGKSSFAKKIAAKLGILYVDSGAMYRGITLWALENNAIINSEPDEEKIRQGLSGISIEFRPGSGSGINHLFLNAVDREEDIRTMEVSSYVSPVSRIAEVRERMVELQRKMAENRSLIMDGRDIGTVVFPQADIKIFMTADPVVRAERRFKELREKGQKAELDEVIRNINERDRIDQSREISPLKKADDAVVLDNSDMTFKEQMEWFLQTFENELK